MLESLKKIKADLLKAAYEIADEKQYKTDLNTYERMLLKNETKVDGIFYKEMIFLNDEVAKLTIDNLKQIAEERNDKISFTKIYNENLCIYGITIDKRKRRTLPERIGCADRFSIGRIQERFYQG